MSRELQIAYAGGSSSTLYAVIRRPSDVAVWNVTAATGAFETWGTLGRDADDYDIGGTHRGGGFWTADFPSDVPSGDYTIGWYLLADSTPADTDILIGQDHGRWNGSAWLSTFDLMQGPGQTLVTIAIRTTGGTALQGISVWLNDEDDETDQICYPRTTDAGGQVQFYLTEDTTYYVFCGHNNYTFADATIAPVSGTSSFTLDIATLLSPSASDEKMTVAEMVDRVLHLVGRKHTSSDVPVDEIILAALNEASRRIVERVPNALELQTIDTTTFDVTADEYEIDLTDLSDTVGHLHRLWVVVNTTDTREIHFLTRDLFRQAFPNVSALGSGFPARWTRYADTVQFSCPFGADYDGCDIRIDYTKKPSFFTSTESTQTSDLNDADEGLMLWAQSKALKAVAKANMTVLQAAAAKVGEFNDWLDMFECHHDLETEENATEDIARFYLMDDGV